MKISLIIIGLLFLLLTFYTLEIYLDPNTKSDIKTANSLCTAQVNALGFKVPIGSLGQKLLDKEEDCKKINSLILLLGYGWIGYALGGLLFILGLILGKGKREPTK